MKTNWYKKIQLPENQSAVTLQQQLSEWQIPRRIKGYLRQNRRVLINGEYQNMQTVLQPNDRIEFHFLATDFMTATSNYVVDTSQSVDVIWENEDVLVVNKPAGIKTHPNSPGENGTLMNFVQAYLAHDTDAAAYMVHRLDEDTSGAILVAKNPIAVAILNAQLKNKQITRQYQAIVTGEMLPQKGTIDLPIGVDPKHPRLRMINGLKAQTARTHWSVLAYNQSQQTTLVQLDLETGRTHQIRVHLKAVGHPILGDNYYNHGSKASRLLLHGAKISFTVPFSKQILTLEAPLPAEFYLNV